MALQLAAVQMEMPLRVLQAITTEQDNRNIIISRRTCAGCKHESSSVV